MKNFNLPAVLILAVTFSPAAFGGDDEGIDVGDIAVKGTYIAGAPASYLALRSINKELRGAWQDALPQETKAFTQAESALEQANEAWDRAASSHGSVADEYVKARDGYTYTTSRIETQWQWVTVTDDSHVGHGHNGHHHHHGTRTEYRPVQVTVYDHHHVAPDPGRARQLKPELDRLAKILAEKKSVLSEAEAAFQEKKTALESAERALLDGRRTGGAGMAEKIKKLQTKRAVAISALGAASVLALADIGSHVFSGSSLLDVTKEALIKRDPANDRRWEQEDHYGAGDLPSFSVE